MRYTKLAKAEPFSGSPKINLASVFGASPQKPFLLRIPATGQRPMTFAAQNLPEGLELRDNIITGSVLKEGVYTVTLMAQNALGVAQKQVTLEIAPNHILLTPMLAFTSWNAFAEGVSQEKMLKTAYNMVNYGLTEYGYRYVNIDSGWQLEYGGEFDAIQPNPKFPDMKALTDEIHSLGLKCGIYSTPMLTAWGCPPEYTSIPGCTVGEPDIRFAPAMGGIGVVHKEKNNALQWDAWGFDYLKYDWIPTDTVNAELMRQELLPLSRDFGYCVTTNALFQYGPYWSACCNSYRDNGDSDGTWAKTLSIFHSYFKRVDKTVKGHFFDLDMLDVGNCVFKNNENFMTEDEMVVAYSMRAFLNSPVQISSVLEGISQFELDLYCNEEIIALNQDAKFANAVPVLQRTQNGALLYVFEKELQDGTYGYGCFNMGEAEEKLTLQFTTQSQIRDLWAKEDLQKTDALALAMPPHTVRIFKTTQKAKANI